jgi:hypothetical protein
MAALGWLLNLGFGGSGVEIVTATPSRYHILEGPSLGYSILVGPSLESHILEA